jgi:outer membrane receptor protein involved in Fe transport
MSRARWVLRNGELLTETRTLNYALEPDGDYAAAYLAPRLQPWTPLIVEPGLRFERHSYTNDSGWSPRLNASLALGPRTTVRAAWGIYEQAQGLQELSVQDRETTFHPAERAEQRVLGLSHKLESGIELRLEAYERLSSRLRPYWENPVDPFELFPEALYDRTRISPTRGRARGVELIAEHRNNRRFGWAASYAYAVSEEEVGGRWIPRGWDQRHTFYADVTYVPARNWQLSCSWQFHTGWPFTDINYSLVTLNDGSLIYTWAYGPVRGMRAPAYHRLDLRATRRFQLKHGTLRAFVDIFNAYDRQNEVGYDSHYAWIEQGQLHVVKTPGTMLPLLPSAGLVWEF